MKRWIQNIGDSVRLGQLAVRSVAGRRYWVVPLLPLLWVGVQVLWVVAGWRENRFIPVEAQGLLLGVPLMALGTGLGVRIIAGEIDQRTLEIAYTVPGGTHRVWLAKLGGAIVLLAASAGTAAISVFLFCTSFPFGALYGAFQAAVFYLVLAMALATLFKSEATGAMVAVAVLIGNFFAQAANLRMSPMWNPAKLGDFDPADVLAWTVQNRIGFVLATVVIALLAFARAERRERMLGG